MNMKVSMLEINEKEIKCEHQAAHRGHMYMKSKMKDFFGFINGLENILHGIGFKLCHT